MASVDLSPEAWKQATKDALAEALVEQRELFQEMIAEAIEDAGFAEAIREGRQTELVPREEVFGLLGDGA